MAVSPLVAVSPLPDHRANCPVLRGDVTFEHRAGPDPLCNGDPAFRGGGVQGQTVSEIA